MLANATNLQAPSFSYFLLGGIVFLQLIPLKIIRKKKEMPEI